MLLNNSLNVDLTLDSSNVDSAYFSVKLENKAGHKFPSGYPSRRAVLQFIVTDATGDTVFRSGTFDNNWRVNGENPAFESHHDVIRQNNKPQIYEMVMGDVASNFTSVLERAAVLLKDNRLPPAGFTTSHASYDTVKISADANADPDFNKTGSIQGSGIDEVHFHVPLAGVSGNLKVRAKVYYQSVPPKWLDEMFALNSADIDRFRNMYNNADKTPFLVGSDSLVNVLLSTGWSSRPLEPFRVWPTLTHDGFVTIAAGYGHTLKNVEVLTAEGKLCSQHPNLGFASEISLVLPEARGIYIIRMYIDGKVYYQKVVKS
jgi:hypothetical protein